MSEFTIRRADTGDAEALALIGQATFLESFADVLPGSDVLLHCARQHSLADYKKRLAAPDHALWLAEAPKGAPIGYAALSPPELPEVEQKDGDIELKRIYVLSQWHGSGAGGELMRAVREEAAARGHKRLLLGVYGRNGRAIRFYQKSGMEIIGTRRFLVGENRYDDVIMARGL